MNGPWEIRNAADSREAELLVYGRIGQSWLDDVNAAWFAEDLAQITAPAIRVRINSIGGDLFGGIAMYNALRQHPARVTTVVEGLAASAASLVALAGDRVVMRRGSMMMVHPPSALVRGNADELRSTAEMLDKARDAIVSIYEARTGREYDDLRAMVDRETWMTAAEAVDGGFADQIDEDAPAASLFARGDVVVAGDLGFAIDDLPAGAALAAAVTPPVQDDAEPEPEAEPPATETEPDNAADGQPEAAAAPLTIEALEREAPALLASIREAARAEGAEAERARMQAIDDLDVIGHPALVAAAKYGSDDAGPTDAAALVMAVYQAERAQRTQQHTDRVTDAAQITVPAASPPANAEDAQRSRLRAAMVAGGNARRGVRS